MSVPTDKRLLLPGQASSAPADRRQLLPGDLAASRAPKRGRTISERRPEVLITNFIQELEKLILYYLSMYSEDRYQSFKLGLNINTS